MTAAAQTTDTRAIDRVFHYRHQNSFLFHVVALMNYRITGLYFVTMSVRRVFS